MAHVCFQLNFLLLSSTFHTLDEDHLAMCSAFPKSFSDRMLMSTSVPELVAASTSLSVYESDGITRVPTSVSGSWIWNLPCIESEKEFSSKKKYEYSEKAGEYEPTLLKWNSRKSKTCFNPSGCFRAVFDNFISVDELNELRKIHDDEPGWMGRQARFGETTPTLRSVIFKRTGRLLEKLFNLKSEPLVVRFFQRRIEMARKNLASSHWSELHADAQSMRNLQYSAVLHLDDDFTGGQTVFIDSMEERNITLHGDEKTTVGRSDFVVKTGVFVEPKAARLVIFSSGAENFHEKRRIIKGERSPLVYWYDCEENELTDPYVQTTPLG